MTLIRRALMGLVLLAVLATAALLADGLTDEPGVSDVGVILGNKVERDGAPSDRLAARLQQGLELYRSHRVSALIVSGGTGKEGFDEAKVMADWLRARGVPAPAIFIDNQGVDTRATAVNTAALMRAHGWTSATAVTQYFHISRTKQALSKAGVKTVRGSHARYAEWRDLYSIPREVVGYAAYLLR